MKRSPSIDVGSAIKRRRGQLNLNQAQLAKECGLTSSYISLIERGLRTPGLEVLNKIALVLNITLLELLSEQ